MEFNVRVMMAGREIDRISRLHTTVGIDVFVLYRRRKWLVEKGCIHVDALPSIPIQADEATFSTELGPYLDLVQLPMPVRFEDCTTLIRSTLPKIPDAVVVSVATLAQLGLHLLAKEVLMDFLELHRQVQANSSTDTVKSLSIRQSDDKVGKETELPQGLGQPDEDIEELAFDWQPESGWSAHFSDDSALRMLAEQTQRSIGAHTPTESSNPLPDLAAMASTEDWILFSSLLEEEFVPGDEARQRGSAVQVQQSTDICLSNPAPIDTSLPSEPLKLIAEKTAQLGDVALDILRYFADNPHDSTSHAEVFTGYHRGLINAFLSGSLSRYVQKTEKGGWVCHAWVMDVLLVIDADEK